MLGLLCASDDDADDNKFMSDWMSIRMFNYEY